MAVATENVAIDEEMDEETGGGLWEGFKGLFSTGSEYGDQDSESLRYERRLWDHRIERYLDASLPEYLEEFGVLDEIALHVREERLADLTGRTRALMGSFKALDDDIGLQEDRLSAVEKVAKRKGG